MMFKRSHLLLFLTFFACAINGQDPQKKLTIDPLYFSPVLRNLERLETDAIEVVSSGGKYTYQDHLMRILTSPNCAPLMRLCEKENIFKGLKQQVQLFDYACNQKDKTQLSGQCRALMNQVALCKQEIEHQKKIYVNQIHEQRKPILNSPSNRTVDTHSQESEPLSLKNLRNYIQQNPDQEQEEEDDWGIGNIFQNGLNWIIQHPWQSFLGLCSCYILYARLTHRWPFNASEQPAPQQAPAPAPQ